MAELNFDPSPVYQQRQTEEQVYKQKVYLRQLQPPTPQPIDIQVNELLIKSEEEKAPIHVHVAQAHPRTPSPIIIKTAPPQVPASESTQPIIYNKYVPMVKQQARQVGRVLPRLAAHFTHSAIGEIR